MESSRVKSNGDIKIPKSIRDILNIDEGDRVAFIELEDGNVLIAKQDFLSFRKLQDEFSKAAIEKGITEEDIYNDLEQIREEMWHERQK